MDLVLIVLGAVLALLGGIVTQAVQNAILRREQERDSLLHANDVLLALNSLLEVYEYRDFRDDVSVPVSARIELLELLDSLVDVAIRLRTRSNRPIGVELTKVALSTPYRTEDNVYGVTRKVQLKLNAPLIEQYEADCD